MSNIVQFSSIQARRRTETAIGNRALTPRQSRREGKPELPPPATETGKNHRLRMQRREVWREAEAMTRWARALLDFDSACDWAQQRGITESPAYTPASRGHRVAAWREALMQQLLTPAPDANAIEWKRRTFAAGQHQHADTKPERIERAIADDAAFLATHPTRRSNAAAMSQRRAFKAVLRQRIREAAASRNLSDDDIEAVMTLKHHELARFARKHSVDLDWLLASED
jgi:hypothetical protein